METSQIIEFLTPITALEARNINLAMLPLTLEEKTKHLEICNKIRLAAKTPTSGITVFINEITFPIIKRLKNDGFAIKADYVTNLCYICWTI